MNNNPTPPETPMAKEPAAIISSISAAIVAVIGLLVAFGADLTPEQTGAIVTAFGAVATVVAGFITRGKVYSPNTAQKIANEVSDTNNPVIAPPPGKKE